MAPSVRTSPALDCTSPSDVDACYRELIDRPLPSDDAFWTWLDDFSELCRHVWEYCALGHMEHTRRTEDPAVEATFRYVTTSLEPQVAPLHAALQRKCLDEAQARTLTADGRLSQLVRIWKADVDIFRDQNTPLFVKETALAADYTRLCGAMTVEFRGATRTLDQMAAFLIEPARDVREEAWRAMTERRLADREAVSALLDQLVDVRDQIARNAGHADYRAYTWLAKKRFDYTPEMCLTFGEAIEQVVVPLVDEWNAEIADRLDIDRLRPWDTMMDPLSQSPLRPFASHDTARLVAGTRRMIDSVSADLAARFDTMEPGESLDLESRVGKQPGGYQEWLPLSRRAFIFMNATGVQRDIEVLLHEAGHAFHSYEADAQLNDVFLLHAPSEFAEVASMSMELMAADAYGEFYSASDAERARQHTLKGAIRVLTMVAMIDGFQHWLYTHPGHARGERMNAWLALHRRFSGSVVDWTGFDAFRAHSWQRILHLFAYPFYFVEYGIAQLGALQMWLQYKRDPTAAVANYRRALALGGSRPLPELWASAGLSFDFSMERLAPLVDAVRDDLRT